MVIPKATALGLAPSQEPATSRFSMLDPGIISPVVAGIAISCFSPPYKALRLAAGSKRIVTLLRETPKAKLALPIEKDGSSILLMKGQEIFSAYVPSPKGPVFMTLIEKTFGKDVTTRTWETVTKVAR